MKSFQEYKDSFVQKVRGFSLKESLRQAPRKFRDSFISGLPAKPVRTILWGLVVWPGSIGRTAGRLIMASMFVIAPLTGLLLPRIEKTLESQGVDPKTVAELAPDVRVHLKTPTVAGRLHNFMGVPNILWNLFGFYQEKTSLVANSTGSRLGHCTIYVTDFDKRSLKDVISATTDIDQRDLRNIPVTMKEFKMTIIFHEIAHCAKDNARFDKWYQFGSTTGRESDADARSTAAAVRELRNPEIARFMFNWRAVQFSGSHDTALYNDAIRRGVTPLPIGTIDAANDEAEKVVKSGILAVNPKIPGYLSPLARRRVEIYLEGLRYFTQGPQKKQTESVKKLS